MFTSIKLFVVLTLVTCFIAYWSDNLGKKLGKKRISFLGFRPRQTATAITMASSWSIMIVTLLVVMLLDRNTSWALLHFDTINKQYQKLQEETPLLLAKNQTLQQHMALSNVSIARLDKQVSDSRIQLQQAQQGANEARLSATKERENAAEARQSAVVSRQSAATAQQSEAQYRQRAEIEKSHWLEAKQQLGQTQQQLNKSQQQLNQTRQQVQQAKYKVEQFQERLRLTQLATIRGDKKLTHHIKELAQQEADLEQALKQKQATVSTLEEQRKTLDAKVSDLQTTVNDLKAKAADWQTRWVRTASERDVLASLAPLANGNILVTVNQVFAAQTIPANSSSSEALTALRQLLADGNDMIKKPPIAGQELRLVPLNIEAQGQRIQLKEDEIINRLADYISTFDVPASVRLVAAYNQVAGETEIAGRMVVVPVRPAVASGDVISAMTIDGSQGDARIFNQLLALVNEGEKTARSHGVMPPQSPSNPDFYAAGTNERIFEALRRIQAIKGPARVRLLAATDLSTADAAKVRFDISHLEVSRP